MAKNYNEKIVFGMSNIHVATVNEDGTFGVPVSILGAKAVEASFESGEQVIHADNKAVYSDKRITKGSGKLSVLGLTTDEKCLLAGTENMSGGFAINATTNAPSLALLFEQDKADGGKLLNVIYNVQFSIPSISAVTTEEEMEEQIAELDFTCLQDLEDGYYYYAVDTKDSKADATMIGKWFTEVQKPKATAVLKSK
ncbi:major tail protein [Romboutsia lituseburensis]|uniref:major tail protein n=1 Tax=Romboutsia lituseburensis TaxID=1537 RepID=UPI0022EB813C|nr:major tail protein [Romboutsia lituseburensis]